MTEHAKTPREREDFGLCARCGRSLSDTRPCPESNAAAAMHVPLATITLGCAPVNSAPTDSEIEALARWLRSYYWTAKLEDPPRPWEEVAADERAVYMREASDVARLLRSLQPSADLQEIEALVDAALDAAEAYGEAPYPHGRRSKELTRAIDTRTALLHAIQPTRKARPAMDACPTTGTRRFTRHCDCATYEGNGGACGTWELGDNGKCAYCDHLKSCHRAIQPRETAADAGEIEALAKDGGAPVETGAPPRHTSTCNDKSIASLLEWCEDRARQRASSAQHYRDCMREGIYEPDYKPLLGHDAAWYDEEAHKYRNAARLLGSMQPSADLWEIEAHLAVAISEIDAEDDEDQRVEWAWAIIEYVDETVLPALRSLQKPSEPVGQTVEIDEHGTLWVVAEDVKVTQGSVDPAFIAPNVYLLVPLPDNTTEDPER